MKPLILLVMLCGCTAEHHEQCYYEPHEVIIQGELYNVPQAYCF